MTSFLALIIRAALLILSFLTLLPFNAAAQKGWVRMPDGPWREARSVKFFSESHGVVEAIRQGEPSQLLLYFSTDSGLSWRLDTALAGRYHEYCGFNGKFHDLHDISGQIDTYYDRDRAIFGGGREGESCAGGSFRNGFIVVYDARRGQWSFGVGGTDVIGSIEVKGDLIQGSSFNTSDEHETHLRSTDGGEHWQEFKLPSPRSLAYMRTRFQNPDTGFVLGIFGGFRTVDGCKSWSVLPDSFFSRYNGYNIQYGNDGLWYSGQYSSSDVGTTWTLATTQPKIDSSIFPKNLYSFSEGYMNDRVNGISNIYYTQDKGVTKTLQAQIDSPLVSISAVDDRVAYAVGPNGILYKTIDGGGRFASVANSDEKQTKLEAWTKGDEIVVENSSDEIQVFDMLGRLVRASRGEKLDGFAPGMYVVVSGGESVRVLVSPL